MLLSGILNRLCILLLCILVVGCNQRLIGNGGSNEYGLDILPEIYNPIIYSVQNLKESVIVDGDDSDNAWNSILFTNDFFSIVDGSKSDDGLGTKFKMGVYGDTLYFFIRIYDGNIWCSAHLSNSYYFSDDIVNLYFDGNADEYDYFVLHLSPEGTVLAEFFERDKKKPLYTFNLDKSMARFHSVINGTINNPSDTDQYWQMEIALPLEFSYNGVQMLQKGDFWKLNIRRNLWQTTMLSGEYKKVINGENGKKILLDSWDWNYLWGNDINFVELWGDCVFNQDLLHYNENSLLVEDRTIRWELRNIYYAQQIYFKKNNRYAKKIASLKETGFLVSNLKYNPEIRARKNDYQAIIYMNEGSLKFTIDSNGRIEKKSM